MPKSASRNSYTVRILEIVKNVKKQNIDINNILRDIRDVQVCHLFPSPKLGFLCVSKYRTVGIFCVNN
jgi:recombinational DNA repair protein RecR